jgi:hypothetical protein
MITQKRVRVVLLVGADGDLPHGEVLQSESTPLAKLFEESGGALDLTIVSLGTSRSFDGVANHTRLDQLPTSHTDRLLRAVGAYAVRGQFDTFPIGRLLNSLGPIAPSRVFWRALKGHPDAMQLLRTSDIAIATDLETTKAAWLSVHRRWVDDAYYDHRALSFALGPQSPLAS